MFNSPRNFQSLTLNKILTELCLLTVLQNIIQQHLTKRTAYISDYVKPLSELSCLESRLISELQGAPGSRDHQASPSSLFGYQNTTDSEPATPGVLAIRPFYTLGYLALPWWLCHLCPAKVALPPLFHHGCAATLALP